ncbi:acyltransferase family-domain-containing protein [Colletotrichum acutatum]|uniref:Acyltransferase family-domain-containing protein n=1 Tax=Glomerella acutata TaxID=27357 RepID=A0AAD8UDQ3_GLOAC|nr:acyltransferase family-domain-containing protein [Colletotrichum acutatum]KAK1712893.1 acyltransferase family-domain-containing protein [Colletotrichum acutatum]
MRFTNPFSHPPRDTYERHSLIAEQDGRASPSTESLDEIIDIEKREYPFLVSVRSARNSVSSFLNEHLHLGGDLTWTDRLLTLLTTLKPFVFLFLPTFFISPFNYFTTPLGQRPKPRKLGPTAYLDGLRGVAAFVVYIFHFSYLWFPDLRWGYGFAGHQMFWQMPIVRALHSGRASVTVFFVISGFVLTLKTVSMIHKRKMDQALSALAGSAFRRPFRLYLPIFASTFIIALLVYGGEYVRDPSGAPVPPRGPSLDQQLQHWFWSTVNLMNPFRAIVNRENMKGSEYDGHLWTIPVEFKGSLLVFFLLLIFARAKRWVHMVGVTGITLWLVHIGDWDQALFCAGLLLAELSIIMPNTAPTTETTEDQLPSYRLRTVKRYGSQSIHIFRHAGTVALFFLGLYLFSYPEYYGASTPGFITISQWVPDYYKAMGDRTQLYWNSIGAIIFIFALMYSPPAEPLLQRPFTTSFAQYLGQISYSLYLWHGAINHMVGVRWLSPAHAALSLAGAQAKLAFFWGSLVNTLALLWASDVFNRIVDVNAVKLTRWLGEKAWRKD